MATDAVSALMRGVHAFPLAWSAWPVALGGPGRSRLALALTWAGVKAGDSCGVGGKNKLYSSQGNGGGLQG